MTVDFSGSILIALGAGAKELRYEIMHYWLEQVGMSLGPLEFQLGNSYRSQDQLRKQLFVVESAKY